MGQTNTIKLYEEDSALRRFTARVTACEPAGDRFILALDATAFYPEGGGQPADTGRLGEAAVLDVHAREGVVWHTTLRPLPVGASVEGEIDWERRFDHMQQHSGEHIVSGVAWALYGFQNIGFHLGSGQVTIDWDGQAGEEQLREIERRANEAVFADLPVSAAYPPPGELAALSYRSKKELSGPVRIVTVPGTDVCACCGTHVARTGQIGLIRLTGAQAYKGGTRVSLACGGRALRQGAADARDLSAVAALLSVRPWEAPGAVERLLAQAARRRQALAALRRERMEDRARALPFLEGNRCVFEEDLSPAELRQAALLLRETCGGVAAVFSAGEDGCRYALASSGEDVRPLAKRLSGALHGRGGGTAELCQGSVSETSRQVIEELVLGAWGSENPARNGHTKIRSNQIQKEEGTRC